MKGGAGEGSRGERNGRGKVASWLWRMDAPVFKQKLLCRD